MPSRATAHLKDQPVTKSTKTTEFLAGLFFSCQVYGSTITNSQGVPFEGTPNESENGKVISITGGVHRDDNLFFSFNKFVLDDNDTAIYLNPKSLNISRIINRALGGFGSTIGGTIDTSQFEGADYYFIDPKGITFHGSAYLDIRGSFFATTAEGLKLDDTIISIYDPDLDSLGNSAVSFVIIDGNESKISFIEPKEADPVFTTLNNNDFFVLSSDVEFNNGTLIVLGGDIFLSTSTDKNGVINTSEAKESITAEGISHGNITLVNSNIISINSTTQNDEIKGGGIYISSEDLLLNQDSSSKIGNNIISNVMSQSDKQLFIRANGFILINDNSTLTSMNTINSTEPTQSKPLNLIEIVGFKQLEISNGSTITSSVSSAPFPLISGSIRLASPDSKVTISGESSVVADSSGALNRAGDINISTDSLYLEDNALILASASGFGETTSGDININARIVNIDKSSISSAASGSARGGGINIKGFETTNLFNESIITSSSFGTGEGGEIILEGKNIYVQNNSRILSRSESPNKESHSGTGGDIYIVAKNILLSGEESKISADALRSDAGNVFLETSGLISLKSSKISTSVSDANGSGGNISFNGKSELSTLYIDPEGRVEANTQRGRGGLVSLKNYSVLGYIPGENIQAVAGNPEGIDGEIRFVNSTVDSVSGNEELPDNILDISALASKRCHSAPGGRSNFFINDRQGVGASPADLLPTIKHNPTRISRIGPKNSRSALERAKFAREPVFFTCQNQLK